MRIMNQIIYDIFYNLIGYLPYAMTTGLLLFSMILLFNRYILKIKLQDYDHGYQYRILLAYILYNYSSRLESYFPSYGRDFDPDIDVSKQDC